MRTLSLSPILLAMLSCTDGKSGPDVADTATADGEQMGEGHAGDTDDEFAGDSTDIRLAKSAAIVIAIDQADIQQATVAIDTSTNSDVRDFAKQMQLVHADHLDATAALLADFDLDPLPNVISDQLELEAADSLDLLDRSIDFDFDYMRLEVTGHAEAFVIAAELANLQPNTSVAHQFFIDTSVMLADHRNHAQVILRGL